MKKVILNKFDKQNIGSLPRAVFEGEITVVDKAEKVDAAVKYLLSQPLLGVDTETRPSFRKGTHYQVALLQVSDLKRCFLFRLNKIGMPAPIIKLLEDTSVPKIGLSWHDDLLMLHKRAKFTPGNFIDLQKLVGYFGIEDLSLQKIYANIFGMRISKREQLSNWDASALRDNQQLYAATDAWACLMLYNELKRLKETGDFELVKVEEQQTE